jgi:hypothetical protein
MRVSIIAVDNAVVIDGKYHISDCSGLVVDHIRAMQWYGDHGEVEFVDHVAPNEKINDLAPFQPYIDAAKLPSEPEPVPMTQDMLPKLMTPEEAARQHHAWLKEHPDWEKQQQDYDKRFQAELKRLSEGGT